MFSVTKPGDPECQDSHPLALMPVILASGWRHGFSVDGLPRVPFLLCFRSEGRASECFL